MKSWREHLWFRRCRRVELCGLSSKLAAGTVALGARGVPTALGVALCRRTEAGGTPALPGIDGIEVGKRCGLSGVRVLPMAHCSVEMKCGDARACRPVTPPRFHPGSSYFSHHERSSCWARLCAVEIAESPGHLPQSCSRLGLRKANAAVRCD
jgi:hypothetical protein